MSIKPIDLQTNINQMHEVGKVEHSRLNALNEQQLVMDKHAAEKSNLAKSKLDETEKGEKTAIRDEDKKNDKRFMGYDQGGEKKKDEPHPRDRMKDEKMGNIIDVLK